MVLVVLKRGDLLKLQLCLAVELLMGDWTILVESTHENIFDGLAMAKR